MIRTEIHSFDMHMCTSARPCPPGGVCLEAYLHMYAAYPINPSFTVMFSAKKHDFFS